MLERRLVSMGMRFDAVQYQEVAFSWGRLHYYCLEVFQHIPLLSTRSLASSWPADAAQSHTEETYPVDGIKPLHGPL